MFLSVSTVNQQRRLDTVIRRPFSLFQVSWPCRACFQCCGVLLKPLVVMTPDLRQKGEFCRRHGNFRYWLNRREAGQLRDMDFVGAECHGRLSHECIAWQEIDRARSPGLTGQDSLADGEDIVGAVKSSCFVSQANTGVGDGHRKTVPIHDGKEHGPQTIRGGIDSFLIAKFVEVVGLARLEEGDMGIARSMQGNAMMIGHIAKELPLGPGQIK